jgi:hypothetical protein
MNRDEEAIVGRCQGLRAGPGIRRPGEIGTDSEAGRRYALWRRHLADGDDRRMRRSLRRDGLWPGAVRHRRAPAEPPAWLPTLRRIMTATGSPPPVADAERAPFAEILEPCVATARALLDARLTDRRANLEDVLTPCVRTGLEQSLRRRLSWLASPCLYAAFDQTRVVTRWRRCSARRPGHWPRARPIMPSSGERWPMVTAACSNAFRCWPGALP